MKYKIFFGFEFFITALIKVIDWFVYCNKNRKIKTENYEQFIVNYEMHINKFIPILNRNIFLTELVFLISSAIGGMLLFSTKKRSFQIVGILSFILSAFHLFSIM